MAGLMGDGGYGAIGGNIAAGMQGFFQGLNEQKKTNMQEMELNARLKAQDELSARNKALDEYNRQKDQQELRDRSTQLDITAAGQGGVINQEGKFEPNQARLQNVMNINTSKAMIDPYGSKRLAAELAAANLKSTQQKQERSQLSPLPGYRKTPNYVGSETEEKELREGANEATKFSNIMGTLKQKVQNASQADLANPYSQASKDIQQDLRNLQLVYKSKNFANLGVLTGPDLSLLEKIVESPGSVSNLLGGKEGVLKRYDTITNNVTSAIDSKAKLMGLEPIRGASGGWMSPDGMMPPNQDQNTPPDDQAKLKRLQFLKAKQAAGSKVANGS